MIKDICKILDPIANTLGNSARRTNFVLIVLGFIVGGQGLSNGVSAIVRTLGLGGSCYNSFIKFFQRGQEIKENLVPGIRSFILKHFKTAIIRVDGRSLLIIDAKKKPKEGKKMPGVKRLHDDSSSNCKPTSYFGHSVEMVGILISGVLGVQCLPLNVAITSGFKRHNRDSDTMMDKAGEFAADLAEEFEEGVIYIADAWYAAAPFINKVRDKGGHIISRIARNAVAFERVEIGPEDEKKRGRKRKYGTKVLLSTLFSKEVLIATVVCTTAGKEQHVEHWSKDYLMKSIGKVCRYVGVRLPNGTEITLVSTDLTLEPRLIIQAYLYRTSIETTFWHSTQTIYAWGYRFWAKMEEVVTPRDTTNLHKHSEEEKTKFWDKMRAYELYLLLGLFSQVVLLHFSLNQPKIASKTRYLIWFRSKSRWGQITLTEAQRPSEQHYQEFCNSTFTTGAIEKLVWEKITNWREEMVAELEETT